MLLPTIKGRPVLLPAHEDHELGQPIKHYHVDPRFVKGNKPIIFADTGEQVVMKEFSNEDPCDPTVEFGVGMYLQLLHFYEGRKLCGTKCPHKGVEVFHKGQCQGHGLRFDESGTVVGKMAECYLRIAGTKSVSIPGNFDYIKVVENAIQMKEVELVWNGIVLAKSKVGPTGANRGEHVRFSFAIGQNASCPVRRSVVSCDHPDTGEHSSTDVHVTTGRLERTELSVDRITQNGSSNGSELGDNLPDTKSLLGGAE